MSKKVVRLENEIVDAIEGKYEVISKKEEEKVNTNKDKWIKAGIEAGKETLVAVAVGVGLATTVNVVVSKATGGTVMDGVIRTKDNYKNSWGKLTTQAVAALGLKTVVNKAIADIDESLGEA